MDVRGGWFENGSMVLTCPGDFTIKAASFRFEGPGNINPAMPNLPKSDLSITDSYPTTR